MANLKDTIVLGNLTVTGSVTASSILGSTNRATSADYPTGFASRPNSITWGTLAESTSYVTRWDDPSGGSVAFGHSGGKTSMQIDGYYYQEEGAYQVLDNRYMWNHMATPNGANAATGMVYVNTRMAIKGNGASYNEGLRILPASNGWSNIFFSGDDSLYNTHSGGWLLGRRGAAGTYGGTGDFTIENNGSNGNGLTLYANGSRPRWNGNELAYKSDCKNPTNYYWANVKVSSASSTSTSPTFATMTATHASTDRISSKTGAGTKIYIGADCDKRYILYRAVTVGTSWTTIFTPFKTDGWYGACRVFFGSGSGHGGYVDLVHPTPDAKLVIAGQYKSTEVQLQVSDMSLQAKVKSGSHVLYVWGLGVDA